MKVWTAALELKQGLDLHCEAAVKSISQWTKVWGCHVRFNNILNMNNNIMNNYSEKSGPRHVPEDSVIHAAQVLLYY